MAAMISSARALMGSSGGYSIRKGQGFLCRDGMSVAAILGENRYPQPEMQSPPLLPAHSLRRVLAISRVDGWSVVGVAGLSVLFSLWQGSYAMAAAALMVALTGAIELHGRRLLLQRQPQGLGRLIGAQIFLLIIIWLYAWYRWQHFDTDALWAELPGVLQAHVTNSLLDAGLDPEFHRQILLKVTNQLTCAVLALVSLVYQGGLAFWYARQRARIRQALLASP